MKQKIKCMYTTGKCKDITDTIGNRIYSLNNMDDIELEMFKNDFYD